MRRAGLFLLVLGCLALGAVWVDVRARIDLHRRADAICEREVESLRHVIITLNHQLTALTTPPPPPAAAPAPPPRRRIGPRAFARMFDR